MKVLSQCDIEDARNNLLSAVVRSTNFRIGNGVRVSKEGFEELLACPFLYLIERGVRK